MLKICLACSSGFVAKLLINGLRRCIFFSVLPKFIVTFNVVVFTPGTDTGKRWSWFGTLRELCVTVQWAWLPKHTRMSRWSSLRSLGVLRAIFCGSFKCRRKTDRAGEENHHAVLEALFCACSLLHTSLAFFKQPRHCPCSKVRQRTFIDLCCDAIRAGGARYFCSGASSLTSQ